MTFAFDVSDFTGGEIRDLIRTAAREAGDDQQLAGVRLGADVFDRLGQAGAYPNARSEGGTTVVMTQDFGAAELVFRPLSSKSNQPG
ncbi:hypothetical protein FFK22_040695 [Mycobacterium sp. KBS0706]|nr:hypothetical protein FFK22_040695 [Mycobacterium sp. KBS0706]